MALKAKPEQATGLDAHPVILDLFKNKGDQVAAMLRAGMLGWLDNDNIWTMSTEARYDRTNKRRSVTYSMFSNLGDVAGYPVTEEPFFQLEVDRQTKKGVPLKELPFGFGVDASILNYPVLRDMSYPYLFLITVLTRHRNCVPVGLYPESEDRPLQIDLVGGQSVWRIMLWQNRLIREYNRAIKLMPELHVPVEDIHHAISKVQAVRGGGESGYTDRDADVAVPHGEAAL